jgi:hypothetical protein
LGNWKTKDIKQLFSDIGQQAAQTYDPTKKKVIKIKQAL